MRRTSTTRPGLAKPDSSVARTTRVNAKCACGAFNGKAGTTCSRCAAPVVQFKLSVGAADDVFEREADRIAEQVTAGTRVAGHRTLVAGAAVRRHSEQRPQGAPAAPSLVHDVLQGIGTPMEPAIRTDMEGRFGHDFSRVRIHADTAAAASARMLGARAYTSGYDIVFGAGHYAPRTSPGRRLLAHELTHVLQQTAMEPVRASWSVIQRDSTGFNPIPSPKDLRDQYVWHMAHGDDFRGITDRLVLAASFHPEPVLYLQEFFDYIDTEWEDNIAAELVSRFSEGRLDKYASSRFGRYLLSMLYAAMITGKVSDFQRAQAMRVLYAKARQYDPDDFAKMTKRTKTPDGGSRPIRVFPIRYMRVTPSDYAPPEAKLLDDGFVRVKYPVSVLHMKTFKDEVKTIPTFFTGKGDVVNANEIVAVKDYESGGRVEYVPALALIDYANRATRSTIGKIGEVSAFAATLGIGSGVAAGGRVAAGEAGVARFTSTALWSARISRGLQIADRVANVVGIAAFVIDENREWIVDKLGAPGRWLVKAADVANSAAAIYGLGRLAQGGFQIARQLHRASTEARKSAFGLSKAETDVMVKIDDQASAVVREMDEAAEAAKAAKNKIPETSAHGGHVDDLATAGKPGGANAKTGKPRADVDDIHASAATHKLSAQRLEAEVKDLSRQTRNPDNVRLPADNKLDAELLTEMKKGDPHQFERHRAARTWCRHSDEACGLNLGQQLNKDVDDAIAKQRASQATAAKAVAPPTRPPHDMKSIHAPVEDVQQLGSNFSVVKLKPNQDALYILRSADGEILKVGKTSARGAKGRFSVYKRAGDKAGMKLDLEVYPLEVQPHPLKPGVKNAEHYEYALRKQMEGQGQKLPWDNTGRRLGKKGHGTPGEGIRSPPITRGEMTELLEFHKGSRTKVSEELGVHERTVGMWSAALGIDTKRFK